MSNNAGKREIEQVEGVIDRGLFARIDFFHTRMQAANGSRKISFLLTIVKWVKER